MQAATRSGSSTAGRRLGAAEELRASASGPALSLDQHGRLLALTEEVSGQPQVVVRRREGLVWSERELVSDPRGVRRITRA